MQKIFVSCETLGAGLRKGAENTGKNGGKTGFAGLKRGCGGEDDAEIKRRERFALRHRGRESKSMGAWLRGQKGGWHRSLIKRCVRGQRIQKCECGNLVKRYSLRSCYLSSPPPAPSSRRGRARPKLSRKRHLKDQSFEIPFYQHSRPDPRGQGIRFAHTIFRAPSPGPLPLRGRGRRSP